MQGEDETYAIMVIRTRKCEVWRLSLERRHRAYDFWTIYSFSKNTAYACQTLV